MSILPCQRCGSSFEAREAPHCPRCLARTWDETEDLVREKHDPSVGAVHDRYRSILSQAFLRRRREVLDYAAAHGRWLFDTYYGGYVHFTPTPLGIAPGVGIRAGREAPDHALDSLLIAEADTTPHAFAVDRVRIEAQIRVGEFRPLPECTACENLALPGDTRCAAHATPSVTADRATP